MNKLRRFWTWYKLVTGYTADRDRVRRAKLLLNGGTIHQS